MPEFFIKETDYADSTIALKNVVINLFAGFYKQGGEMLVPDETRAYYADMFVATQDLIDACYQYNQDNRETDEPETVTTLNDLIGPFAGVDFTKETAVEDENEAKHLAALCSDIKDENDLKILDTLARQGYAPRQLSDLAFRMNKG